MAAGLGGLMAAAALGFVFTQVLGGTLWATALVDIAADGVPVHAAAALGGWLAMCAVGVSYRLFPMFLLSPDPEGVGTRFAFLLSASAASIAVRGRVAALLADWFLPGVLLAAGLAAAGSATLYGRDVVNFYRGRRSRELELNMRIATLAFASLGTAAVLPFPVMVVSGRAILVAV